MERGLNHIMEVYGSGRVFVEPDLVAISLGVETVHQGLQIAQEENTMRMEQVIRTIRRMGVNEEDIQTEFYNIEKRYEFIEGRQIDKGYAVTNRVRIQLRDLEETGEIVDAAVANGANLVSGISFEVEDPSYYYNIALNLALEEATDKAASMGRQMGVRVLKTPLRIIEESEQPPIRFEMRQTFSEDVAATPILPGQIELSSRVKVIFRYE